MDLKSALRPAYYKLQFTRSFGLAWAQFLVDHRAWLATLASPADNAVQLYPGGPVLHEMNAGALIAINGIEALQALGKIHALRLEVHEDWVLLEVSGVKFRAESPADLLVVQEVYGESVYCAEFPSPIRVLDFGANIGVASLYFAQHYSATVDAYELLPSTTRIAEANLQLNPTLAGSIRMHAFGVGPSDGEFEVAADPAVRTSVSIQKPLTTLGVRIETARVRAVSSIFESLEHSKLPLLVKIDIEGAEYDLMPALEPYLPRIDFLVVEWHQVPGRTPQEIAAPLIDAGYKLRETLHPSLPSGMFFAARTRVSG